LHRSQRASVESPVDQGNHCLRGVPGIRHEAQTGSSVQRTRGLLAGDEMGRFHHSWLSWQVGDEDQALRMHLRSEPRTVFHPRMRRTSSSE